MRRPLVRHLSEGGGGAGSANDRRQFMKSGDDDRAGGYNLNSRDYRHHLSSCDLLKVPPTNHRGRISPEPRITLAGVFNRYRTALLHAKLPSIFFFAISILCLLGQKLITKTVVSIFIR